MCSAPILYLIDSNRLLLDNDIYLILICTIQMKWKFWCPVGTEASYFQSVPFSLALQHSEWIQNNKCLAQFDNTAWSYEPCQGLFSQWVLSRGSPILPTQVCQVPEVTQRAVTVLSRPRGCSGKERRTELERPWCMYFSPPSVRNPGEPWDYIVRGYHGEKPGLRARILTWHHTYCVTLLQCVMFIYLQTHRALWMPLKASYPAGLNYNLQGFLSPSVKWGEWLPLLCLPRLLGKVWRFSLVEIYWAWKLLPRFSAA